MITSRRSKKWVVGGNTESFVWMAYRISQRFCKEVVAWKGLRHPNVLPLFGVTMVKPRFVIVSEWMQYGNINEFVKKHPDEDRLKLVRFLSRFLYSLITDEFMTAVACGCHQGTDIYAHPRNHSRKSPGGTCSNYIVPPRAPSLT